MMAFQEVLGPNGASKWPQTAPKRAQNACLSTQDGPGSSLKKHAFSHFWTPFRSQNGPLGAKQCLKTVQIGVKTALKCVFERPKCSNVIFGGNSFSAVFGPILWPFRGQITPFAGEKQAKRDHKAARTSPKWILSQDTATRPRWSISRGHRAPFEAVLGLFWCQRTLSTGQTRAKTTNRDPTRSRVDSVPRHGHWTPAAPTPPRRPRAPFGAVLGPFRGKIGRQTHLAGGKYAQWGATRAQQDP